MLGLYMLGTPLERHWGPKRFLRFYLTCGVVAGLAYVTIGWIVGNFAHTPIIGASGGVYALVLACAVLFPHMRLILFLFPVPIRLAAALIFGGMILLLAQSFAAGRYAGQFWSDVAHLGGAAAAAVWIFLGPRIGRATSGARKQINRGAWDRKVQARQDQQKEVDRILQKIQDEGIGSLTRREKQTLSDATRRQRHDEKHFRG
jgi:membrane associated rhomboid family serine protease